MFEIADPILPWTLCLSILRDIAFTLRQTTSHFDQTKHHRALLQERMP